MSDKPIIFSGPMVRAILDGRKTQTRRLVKPQPSHARPVRPQSHRFGWDWVATGPEPWPLGKIAVPYAPGDRLWVREAWRTDGTCDARPPWLLPWSASVYYAADGAAQEFAGRYRHALHMPRWSSRLTLTVTDVRVQRLQEISRGDAMAEGCPFANMADGPDPRDWLRNLWNSIHGPDAWDANPWVVALTFTAERRNIDARDAA